jgi:hypothetical protein
MLPSDEDPITGKGEEMLPDKGFPFAEFEETGADPALTALTEEELLAREDDFALDAATELEAAINTAENPVEPMPDLFEDLLAESEPTLPISELIGAPEPAEPAGMSQPAMGETIDPDAFAETPPSESDLIAALGTLELSDVTAASLASALFPDQAAAPETLPPMQDSGMGAGFVAPEDDEVAAIAEAVGGNAGAGDSLFSALSLLPPDPTTGQAGGTPPALTETPGVAKEIQESLVTEARIHELWQRAEVAATKINHKIESLPIARQLLDLVRDGKNLLISGKDNYEEADRFINEVEYRLALADRVKGYSEREARQILWYEIGWGTALGIGLVLNFTLVANPDWEIFIAAALAGGMGGVLGALYSLWTHVAREQDYSPQYNMWYYTQPLMGVPIGMLIYLFINTGIQLTVAAGQDISNPLIVYTLAGVAGYQQNVAWDIIRQILKAFKLGGDS